MLKKKKKKKKLNYSCPKNKIKINIKIKWMRWIYYKEIFGKVPWSMLHSLLSQAVEYGVTAGQLLD